MAKKEEDDPKPWTPDQPLDDEEDEAEVQRRARATLRLNHLTEEMTKPPKKKGEPDPKKKHSLW